MAQPDSIADLTHRLGDRYTIERELGRGGMGAVYLARDIRLDRPVALKVLPADVAADSGLRERFLRETRTAASFSHPNIVPVHAVEDRDGVMAFAMGYVEGESLAQRVSRAGPLDLRATVRLLQDVGYALAYAHGRGVVHRDIKPDNIMLERATGRALLMDFGISRPIAAPIDRPGLTRVGEVVGTPEYMSPEQASGDTVDGRSDLYALGLVALFALTGRAVITGDTTHQILVKQLTELPPSAATLRPDLPAPLTAVIDRCVAKEPDHRFPSAEALIETLDDAHLAAPEIPVPIRLFAHEAGTLGLILVFLSIISWLLYRSIARMDAGVDALLPGIVLLAVAATRVAQTRAEARRLAAAGFGPEDVRKGLTALLAEREAIRTERRADPDIRRRRRITLTLATAYVPLAILLIAIALSWREQVGPRQYRVGWGGMTLVITGFVLLSVSAVLFARSPFRPTLGERVFRRVWLGPFGRWFLRSAGSGARRGTGQVAAAPAAAPAPPGDRIAVLERRVAALEEWRGRGTGSGSGSG